MSDPYSDLVIPEPTDANPPEVDLRSKLVDGAAFVLDEPCEQIALWGDREQILWADGESLIITGSPGVGKTTLVQRLVLATLGIARAELLDLPVSAAARVLYLALDRPRQIARSLRRMVDEKDRQDLRERLVVWPGPPPADFARAPETLITLATAANADVVVIDSLKDAALGLTNDEVGAAVNRAIQYTLAAGVNVLILHHQVKRNSEGGKPKGLPDVYGSAWITGGAGSVVLLHGEAGDSTIQLLHLKQPAEPVGPLPLEFNRHDGTITLAAENIDPLEWLRRQRTPVTAQHLAQAYATGTTATRTEVERARRDLDRLTRTGHANRHPGVKGGPGGGTPSTYTPAAHPAQAALGEAA